MPFLDFRTFSFVSIVTLITLTATPCEAAAGLESKLSIHGYLTQAWGEASDQEVLGIPTDGTADYRQVALQFRYAISDRDSMVVQFSHERLGNSPLADQGDDVELDWAFYERRLESGTAIKVGRVPIPNGIYNKLRDVGILLPFYRPPDTVYGESAFATESIDGIVVGHRFPLGDTWELSLEAYAGEWELLDVSLQQATAKDAIGAQLWLDTPIEGLRLGIAGQRYDVDSQTQDLRFEQLLYSLDGRFGSWALRGELSEIEFDTGDYQAYYGELLFEPTTKLRVALGFQMAELSLSTPILGLQFDLNDETFVGLGWAFSPQAILKLEHHWIDGALLAPSSQGLTIVPADTTYTLLSFSVGF